MEFTSDLSEGYLTDLGSSTRTSGRDTDSQQSGLEAMNSHALRVVEQAIDCWSERLMSSSP